MRHAQLVEGIKRVTEVLEDCGLREALGPEKPDAETLLEALRRYAIAAASFRAAESTVVELLGLAELDSSVVWARLLTGGPARAHYHDRIGFVTHHMPRFLELLEESRADVDHAGALHVMVVGDGGLGLAERKLVTIANSLGMLYRACSRAHGLGVDDLHLVSLECSHDTYLIFDGVAAGIAYVKELLVAAFRWLALYREEHLENRIQLAKDALPIARGIEELRRRGAIDRDEAARLEQEVLLALLAFFDAGALIPEMEADIRTSPRDIVETVRPRSSRKPTAMPELDALADEIAALAEPSTAERLARDSVIDLDDDHALDLHEEAAAELPEDTVLASNADVLDDEAAS
jgi:hypothetical protein